MVMDDGNDPYREDDAVETLDAPEDTSGGYTQNDPYRNARAQELAAATGKADALQQRQGAVGTLSAAEANASKNSGANGGLYKRETNLNDHKNPSAGGGFYKQGSDRDGSKNSTASGFKNSVTGANSTAGSIKKAATGGAVAKLSAAKDLLKNKGPFGVILAVVVVAGLAIFASQSLMPFSLVARFIEEYNVLSYANEARYDKVLMRALHKTNTKSYNTAVESLKKQGITVTTNGDNTSLSWTDTDGQTKTVSAKTSDLDSTIKNTIETDSNFSSKYQSATATWRGNGSGWHDSDTSTMYKNRYNRTQNEWQGWEESDDPESDAQFEEIAKGDNDNDSSIVKENDPDEVDPDDPDSEPETDLTTDNDFTSETNVRKTLTDAAANLSSSVGLVCQAMSLYTIVATLVYAHQVIETVNVYAGMAEAVDKTKAGDGENSPINRYMNLLTQPDENGNTAMNATGISTLYSLTQGSNYNNNEAVQLVNSENAFSNALGMSALAGVTTASAFTQCAYARLAADTVNIALTFMTFGASIFINFIKDAVLGFAQSTAIQTAISLLVPFVVSVFVTNVIADAGLNTGEYMSAGGSKLIQTNAQQSGSAVGNEQSINAYNSEKQKIIASRAEKDRQTLSPFDVSSRYTFMGSIVDGLIAFSTTSAGNAITGSITAIGSVVSNSVTSLLPSASALATTSLNQTRGDCPYLESVGAVGDLHCNPYYVEDFSTMNTDVATVIRNVASFGNFEGYDGNITDDEIQQYLDGELELEIKENSNLYKYIVYCGGRESIYGVADSNIAASLDSGSTGNDTADNLIGVVPVLGDVADAVSAISNIANQEWISGSACVATGTGQWENEYKWYQRFTQDSRLMESMGFFDSSSTAAIEVDQELAEKGIIAYDPNVTYDENSDVLADGQNESTAGLSAVSKAKLAYYEENPIDTSYLGQLSRYSGLTKDTIIAVLDEVDTYLARVNYDPTGRGPATAVEVKTLNNEDLVATLTSKAPVNAPNMTAITPKYIAYQPVEQGTTA